MNNLKKPKKRTNNKITFCFNCIGVLTSAQDNYCNAACEGGKRDSMALKDIGKPKMWVYLNKNMLDLAKSQHISAYEFSYFFWSGHELVGVACFDEGELQSIGDHETNVYDAWWREIGRLNTSFHGLGGKHHRPRVMRELGLLSYLCDEYGLSTEKNIALAIGELTEEEGWDAPADLINSL